MKIIDKIDNQELFNVLKNIEVIAQNDKIFPNEKDILKPFDIEIENVNVVIIGQDPYHGEGQANGFAFAVSKGVKTPPSLKNIFKEVELEFGLINADETLSSWVDQGVLLMNTSLTVSKGKPNSHSSIGWQKITKGVISILKEEEVVFLLLGSYAQKIARECNVAEEKKVITTHPSPLSAHRGFIGSNAFKNVNKKLKKFNKKEIIW